MGEHSLDVQHGCQMCVPDVCALTCTFTPPSHTQACMYTPPVLMCTLTHTRCHTPPAWHPQPCQHRRCYLCRDTPALSHPSTWPPVPAVVSSHTHTAITCATCPITFAQTVTPVPHSCAFVVTPAHTVHTQPLSEPPLHSCLGAHCRPPEPRHTGAAASPGLRPRQTHHTWIRDRSGIMPLVRHSPGIAEGAGRAGDARGAGGDRGTRVAGAGQRRTGPLCSCLRRSSMMWSGRG